jgi:serine/threonine protein kinase
LLLQRCSCYCYLTNHHDNIQLLGTPKEGIWPGVTCLPYWQTDVFPTWPKLSLKHLLSPTSSASLSPDSLSLLQQLLTYDPAKRITAKQAQRQQYFTGTGEIRTIEVASTVVDTADTQTAARKGKH